MIRTPPRIPSRAPSLAFVVSMRRGVARGSTGEGGRVGNPKRLRAQREKGDRKMQRPPIPEPD